MRVREKWIVAVAVCLVAACGHTPDVDTGPTLERDVDALAAAMMAQQEIPGVAVVVMRGDDVVLARGYGVESLSRRDPVTPRTRFVHNSIGKHFTAAAVLALAEDKKLGLDDPVVKHLADFVRLPPQLTVRHLLTHTSGVREAMGIPALVDVLEREDGNWHQMRAVLRQHAVVDWPPGSRWSYSNTNFFLLEALVMQVAGMPLPQLLEKRFFEPHGLSSMRVCPFRAPDARGEAVGYVKPRDTLAPAPGVNNTVSLGAGGWCGSALELARWSRLLATGRLVSARSYADMTSPARLADGSRAEYGFGLALMAFDGVPRAGHNGIGFGYSSVVGYYPDSEMTIAILANRYGFPEGLERQIARRELNLPEPDRRDVGITAEERRRWAGRYDVGMFGWTPMFFERDGRLWFRLFGPTTTFALIRTRDGALVPETVPDAFQFRFRETSDGVTARIYTGYTQPWFGVREGDADIP